MEKLKSTAKSFIGWQLFFIVVLYWWFLGGTHYMAGVAMPWPDIWFVHLWFMTPLLAFLSWIDVPHYHA